MDLYSVGEVCRLLDIKPYVLRYWEQEFPVLNPRKEKNGQRRYSQADLDVLFRIRHLLYVEKFTIDGAKNRIWKDLSGDSADLLASIHAVRESLVSLSIRIDRMGKN